MWGVVGVFIDVPGVGEVVFFEVLVEAFADADEAVVFAAGEEEEVELFGGGFGVWEEFGGLAGVGGWGEGADPGEGFEVSESEVEGLSAAHGEAGEGAVFAVGEDGVGFFDEGDDVLEKVLFEGGEGWGVFEDVADGAVVLLGAAVGHDDDHFDGFFVGDEVGEDDFGRGEALPFGFVAADAVEEVEDGVFFVGGVAGRGVDGEFAGGADGFGFVGDGFGFALGDAGAFFVESFGWEWEGGFVIGAELDGCAEAARGLAGWEVVGVLCGDGEGGEEEGEGDW